MTYEALDYGDAVLFDAAQKIKVRDDHIDALRISLQTKDEQIATLDAKIDDMRLALAGAIVRLREAECYHDGELAKWYGQARRRSEKAFQRSINEYPEYITKDAQIATLVLALRRIKALPPGYGATREQAREIALAAIKETTLC